MPTGAEHAARPGVTSSAGPAYRCSVVIGRLPAVELAGPLCGEAVEALGGVVHELIERGATTIEIDLSGVCTAAAEAVATLGALAEQARDRDARLVLCSPSPTLGYQLVATGFAVLFSFSSARRYRGGDEGGAA